MPKKIEKVTREVSPFHFDIENKTITYNASFLKRVNDGDATAMEMLANVATKFPGYELKKREGTARQGITLKKNIIRNYVAAKGSEAQKKAFKDFDNGGVTFFVLRKWFTDTFPEDAKNKTLLAKYNRE